MWQVWLILSAILFVVEIATTGFLIFWFSIGALFAMIVSFFTGDMIVQTTVFIIASVILIFLTRPFADKVTKGMNVKTNAFSLEGKQGKVIEEINSEESKGKVKVGTEVWSAKSKDIIPEGSNVKVLEIEGVKLVVEKC